MTGVLGFNILGDRAFDRAVLISRVKQLQPAYCVVMNNPGLAAELMPYTTVIVRRFPDDNAQNVVSGAEFVQARAAEVPKGAYLYLGNEPGKEAAAYLDTWTFEALSAAEQLGIKCCILNWATGNPEPADWDKVSLCIQRAVKGGHLIGVHEYWMNTPNQPPSYPYHVGRCFAAVERFGGKWVVTEAGANKDKGGGVPDPYAGWQTFLDQRTYADHVAVVVPMYAQRGIGACFFSYPDWDGHGFGVNDAPTFLSALAGLNARYPILEQPPVNQPYIPPPSSGVNATLDVLPASYVNIREQPYTSAKDVDDLYKGENVLYSTSPQAPGWAYIVRDSDGRAGWVSHQNGAVSFLLDSEPTPDPEPTPDTVTLPKADYDAAILALEDALALLRGGQQPEIPF